MSDLLNELLKNSMEREAKKIAANGGATEQDRYGNLLDSVKGRNLEQEEIDKHNSKISHVLESAKSDREKREKADAAKSINIQNKINEVQRRDRQNANDFIERNKKYLDKAKDTIDKERNKSYFS